MVVIPSTSVAVIGPGAVTDRVQEIVRTDLGLEIVQAPGLAQVVGLGLELVVVTGPVLVQDLVRDKDRVQWIENQAQGQVRGQDQVPEQGQVHAQVRAQDRVHAQARGKIVPGQVIKVLLAATRAGVLLPETVIVEDLVVPANQEQDRQGVQRAAAVAVVAAEVEADVVAEAEVVVVDVDADLKWP